MGDVGPSQILVAVNGRIKVFSKTGTLGALNTTLDNFFASVGGTTNRTSDPHVRYDRLSARWFVTAISLTNTPNNILVAVSSGSTITDTSSFTFFGFQHDQVGPTPNADTGKFADYDTLGVDKFALYVGANIFTGSYPGPFTFSNTTAFVVDKADLLTGTLTVTAFRELIAGCPSGGPETPQGVDNDDPQATEGYFMGVDACFFGLLVVRRVVDPGGTPSLSGNLDMTVPTTTFPQDQPQPSPGPNLDAIDRRQFAGAIHRNKITGAVTLWTAHNIEVSSSGVADSAGNRNGSRWYEIGSLTTTPTLVQSGTLFDPASSTPFGYWIPSVAMSGQGHMALGSSRASSDPSTGFASVAVAGRLRTDVLGTIQAHTLAQGSSFLYDQFSDPPERWGDYSQTVVDPTDDQTMWTFQEYANATNSWGVRVIQLRAPPPATPSSASPSSVAQDQASVNVVISGASTSGSEFFDPGPDTGGPAFANHIGASVSGGVTVNSVTLNSPTQVTLNISTAGATSGTQTVTVNNPDGQSSSGAILTVTTPVSVTLEPPADSNTVGTTHTVTATVKDSSDNVVSGAAVSFRVAGTDGESPTSASAISDAAGRAPFSFTSTKTGTSTVAATSGSASSSATKTWTPGPPASVTLDPATDTNVVGAAHTVTTTVKDQFANNVADGTTVNFGVTGTGAETPSSRSLTTVGGKATFEFTSNRTGTSTVTATAGSASGTATKRWIADAPALVRLEPATATHTVGTTHTVSATVTDKFANLVEDGTTVNFSATGTGGESPSSQVLATTGGVAPFTFTSSRVGKSTVTATAGSASDTATKTWVCGPLNGPYFANLDIARDVALLPGKQCQGYILDGFGARHPFGGAPATNGGPYFSGFDIARRVVINSAGTGGFVLDGFGALHPFGIGGNPPPAKPSGPYFPGFDIARDVLLITDSSGYILDGFGARHPFGGAPPTTGGPYFPGHDIANAFDMIGGAGSSGLVLDGFGGRHPFNGAPAPTGGPYFPGFDIARDIEVSGVSSGYILDGFGARHPFGGAPPTIGGPYFPGFVIARGFVIDGAQGFVLDGFSGLHSFNLPVDGLP